MKRIAGNRSVSREDYFQCPRCPLIVCAVLVHNPANLGGLCRTCEAFRLESMVLADLSITQASPFRGTATSAHHWQPLLACPVENLSTWLIEQKRSGYSLIALHTHVNADVSAIVLPQFVFPLRSVLILGQELTGIPANVLALCNHIVTIPQFGFVESLNVQTAGALAIYEYICQHSKLTLSNNKKPTNS